MADATGETQAATTSLNVRGERPAVALQPDRESVDRGQSLVLRALSEDADTSLRIAVRIVPVTKPNVALNEREWPIPDRPIVDRATFDRQFPRLDYAPEPELAAWPAAGREVYTSDLTIADGSGELAFPADFPVGHYRADWTYADGTAGEPVTFSVYNSATAELPAGVLYRLDRVPDTVRVGQALQLRLIAAVDLPLVFGKWDSRALDRLEVASATPGYVFTYTPTEEDRGGISFSLAFNRFNRLHSVSRTLELPWDNKELTATYATFRDKLRPGAPEEWTITLRNADGTPTAAAALATMYDASLDQLYSGRGWEFNPYPMFYGGRQLTEGASFGSDRGWSYVPNVRSTDTLPLLPRLELGRSSQLDEVVVTGYGVRRKSMRAAAAEEMAENEVMYDAEAGVTPAPQSGAPPPPPVAAEASRDPAPVQIRTNLQETAFWLPDLTADEDGSLRISFTSPEALTAWKFRLFAHDKFLNYTISEQSVVTQKELMVLPNVPRFLREGDALGLTAKVSNLTDTSMQVRVSLQLFDPVTSAPLSSSRQEAFFLGGDAGATQTQQSITLGPSSSATVRFPISVPEGASLDGPLGYRVIARSDRFSDGEENAVPVLSDRTLVTVSRPFYLKRGETKHVTVPQLGDRHGSTHSPVSYTFQATTNPAWLALKALPYLLEYPYDCTEQLANRYFANQLAYASVSSKPVLEEVFRKWQTDSTALLSELERRPELKNALLSETPWVREAQSETEQRARIADLFQLKRLAREQRKQLHKLAARQSSDGSYSWFPNGRADRYMTQYVLETLARMTQLGVLTDDQRATTDRITERAIGYLDGQFRKDYERFMADTEKQTERRAEYVPSPTQVHYLYARAVSNRKISAADDHLVFFRDRAFASWTRYGLYGQSLIAITAFTEGKPLAGEILTSLRERALHSDEFGMYWKYERGYRWNNLPIETHTRLLEAFRRIDPRQEELDDMRLWLLSNKRTNHWPTTKATAAAVYAILQGGDRYTATEDGAPIEVSWRGGVGRQLSTRVRAQQQLAEAATGEFSVKVAGADIEKGLATARVKNDGNDLVWGGVFYQYTDLATEVEANDDGPLRLERSLYRKTGDRLEALTATDVLQPGDRVTVRLTLTSDRDLDYVHLKDRRAATFEPTNALSTYRYQNGLGFYFAPGDLATNFFIDRLPKGTHTLEYELFATYTGTFSNGLGRVQCMYAPEFGGNTAGGRVVVR